MSVTAWLVFSTVLLFVIKRLIDLRAVLNTIRNHPSTVTLFSAWGITAFIFKKPIRYVSRGGISLALGRHREFQELGLDIISEVSIFPNVFTATYVADAAAVKEITLNRARFPKPTEPYEVLTFFGRNILTSEGEEWKKYRKISAPAFSESNNRLVWDSTMKIMLDLFDNKWGSRDEIVVEHAAEEITTPITLFVIAVAGFGRDIGWSDDLTLSPGHKMSFKESIHTAANGVFIKAALPQWIMNWGPTKGIRKVKTAFDELDQYMMEMVQGRRAAEMKDERHDLFTSLLSANEDESDGQAALADRELLGNIFIFLLAGHETTAHALCFALGLLALHEEYQEKLFENLRSILPHEGVPGYELMNLLTEPLAVFYESLRLFPIVPGIPKIAAEDTVLVTTDSSGNKITVPIPQGTNVVLRIPALHHNPRYWDDPYSFKPERFLGDWPRDAFLPFSGGPRACLGRRFAEVESVVVLTMLVSRYKIRVKEEPEFASETFEQKKERVLRIKMGLTTTPLRVPLVFSRRA